MNVFGINRLNRNLNRRNFMNGNSEEGSGNDPRDDSFWKFSRDFCCPTFKFLSATFIISAIDVVIYLLTLIIGGIKPTPFELLAPTHDTLDTFGMKVSIYKLTQRCLSKSNRDRSGDY